MQLKKSSIRPIKILGGLVAIAYPIAVFVALQRGFPVRMLGLILVLVAGCALAQRRNLWLGVCGIILAGLAIISDKDIFLKLYPVFMNAAVCFMFAVSVRSVPLVQRFAEKMKYKITEKSKQYARRVTVAWAIFMGINTIISLITVFMSDWAWTLYNGLISYCLIGLMMVIEYFVRNGVIHADK
ncbi:MAG: hypothetical protein J5613_00675 [Alphaproteobacteria bacterium]|nr:hypothetical protein [Alphaproteobacteria bacterium]